MSIRDSYERLEVITEPDRGVVTITLNRPEKRNALDIVLLDEYCEVLEALMNSAEYRVIVTRGAGPSFCAGMDLLALGEWAKSWDRGEFAWSDAGPLTRALRLLREHTCVTIASVHGYCAGGGLALVVAHDLAVSTDTAKFILPETARGSFGALAAAAIHYALPPKKAFAMQLAGYELPGDEASRYGLVSTAVPEDELTEATTTLADEVATRNAVPLAHAKMAFAMNEGRPFLDTMRLDLLVRTRQDAGRDSFADVSGFLADRKKRS
jgi:enoyl-CoA hydratase/carnithine racemase